MTDKYKLQKYLQDAGIDNRRNIRNWIVSGEIKVNQQVITDPGFEIDPTKDTIHLGNKKLSLRVEKKVYYKLNKPAMVVSTLSDPEGRVTLNDYIKKIRERVYPVGRLDYHSEGLILLTNDGDLTNFIISAKNQIPKIYLIKVKGIPSSELQKKLRVKGVVLDGKRIKLKSVSLFKKTAQGNSWLKVSIVEGKKHIVRKLFKYSGHPVEKLKRTAIGSLQLKKLKTGFWEQVDPADIEEFKNRYRFKPE